MQVIVKWSDGVEDVRDVEMPEPSRVIEARRFHLDVTERRCVWAGRLLNGTPIYYEDATIQLHPFAGYHVAAEGRIDA